MCEVRFSNEASAERRKPSKFAEGGARRVSLKEAREAAAYGTCTPVQSGNLLR